MDEKENHIEWLMEFFGRRLRLARLEANLSQCALGKAAGVRQETISSYETGQSLPSMQVLCRLSSALDVHMTYFFPDSNVMGLPEEQRNVLASLDTLSPVTLEYVLIFVQYVSKMQRRHNLGTESGQRRDKKHQARLLRMLDHDLKQLEGELLRDGNRSQVSVHTLVVFTALALVGIELDVAVIEQTDLARNLRPIERSA